MNFSIFFIFIIIIITFLIVPHDSFAQTKHVSLPSGSAVPGCEETNECFIPAEVSVSVGDTVSWSNDDTAAHTVTSGSVDVGGPDGNFDSSLFMAGTTFEHTFDKAGEYDYFCMVHPWMVGTIIVGKGVAPPPKPAPTPPPPSLPVPSGVDVIIPAGTAAPGCEVTNRCWDPPKITVAVGETVVWTNDDTFAHTVTSGTTDPGPDGNFDSSLFMAGTTFSNTFDTAGEYPYFCMVHPWMVGIVSVGGLPTIPSIPPTVPSIPPTVPSIPSITFIDTQLSLGVIDGSSPGNIKVYPTLNYGSGTLSTNQVEIYVDGNLKTVVPGNQWSSDIWAGSGTHSIKASIPEQTSPSDISIKYRAASDTETFVVKTSSSDSLGFPIEYVIGIVVIAIIASVAILLAKRKKSVQVVPVPPTPSTHEQKKDETQFWVCPHCGRDTQSRNGKQFCSSCNVYL